LLILRQDPEPKGSVDLKGCTFTDSVKGEKKKNLFAILDKDNKETFVATVSSQSDLEAWKKDLTEAFTKDHADAPKSSGGKKKKQGVAMSIKKGAASKGAKSGVGKKVCSTQ
jgi:hypothetical protein